MGNFPLPSTLGKIGRIAGAGTVTGAELTDAVPAGKSWYVLAVQLTLTKGGTGTPQPLLVIDDGTTSLYESFGSSAVQAVNTTCVYTWAPGLPLSGQIGTGANVHATAPLPEGLVLPQGYRLRTNTIPAVGATTSWGTPSYFVCELG